MNEVKRTEDQQVIWEVLNDVLDRLFNDLNTTTSEFHKSLGDNHKHIALLGEIRGIRLSIKRVSDQMGNL